MKTIYKYPLANITRQVIIMPGPCGALTVQTQNGLPFIWVLVDTEKDDEEVTILTFGTGIEWRERKGYINKYVSTYQDGSYVWHIFTEEKLWH